jgi:hypothetical protein
VFKIELEIPEVDATATAAAAALIKQKKLATLFLGFLPRQNKCYKTFCSVKCELVKLC